MYNILYIVYNIFIIIYLIGLSSLSCFSDLFSLSWVDAEWGDAESKTLNVKR